MANLLKKPEELALKCFTKLFLLKSLLSFKGGYEIKSFLRLIFFSNNTTTVYSVCRGKFSNLLRSNSSTTMNKFCYIINYLPTNKILNHILTEALFIYFLKQKKIKERTKVNINIKSN